MWKKNNIDSLNDRKIIGCRKTFWLFLLHSWHFIIKKKRRRKYHILKCQHWTVMLLLTHTIVFTCFNEIFVQKWQYLEICNNFLPYHFLLFYQWYYFIRICCTPDIILPSRKRRVINLKTIHRGTNQLVFFQALVLMIIVS